MGGATATQTLRNLTHAWHCRSGFWVRCDVPAVRRFAFPSPLLLLVCHHQRAFIFFGGVVTMAPSGAPALTLLLRLPVRVSRENTCILRAATCFAPTFELAALRQHFLQAFCTRRC